VSDLERKSVEPIALSAGVPPRTLQEFLGLHRWDENAVRRKVQKIVRCDHADENAIGVIDETSVAKKGNKTAGVQRQYCGSTGKTDNCVVTVHLGYVAGEFQTLIDTDLYLPEETWHQDRERCREAGIPDTVVYRPKWQIALDLLTRSCAEGIRLKFVTADEEYGGTGGFREGVSAMGLVYVVEIPRLISGWTKTPLVHFPSGENSPGRPRTQPYLASDAAPARRVDALWERGGPSWETFHIKNTEKGPVVWEARIARFSPAKNGLPGEEGWLIVARNVLDGEVKYFLSNAPETTPVEILLHVAFSRYWVERLFEDGKGEVGMDHFEVRTYLSLMRHMILSMVSFLFLARETQRLRGKKSVVECVPGEDRSRGATGGKEYFSLGKEPASFPCGVSNRILATSRSCCGSLPSENAVEETSCHGHLHLTPAEMF
jgi:SRSO17 transposase